MDESESTLRALASRLLSGELDGAAFCRAVEATGCDFLAGATVDVDRHARCGYPEVVFAEGKPIPLLRDIVAALRRRQQPLLVTRVNTDQAQALLADYPNAIHHPVARTLRAPASPRHEAPQAKTVAIVTAGTCDLPVAEEARETLRWMQMEPSFLTDVGVAGPHRLRCHLGELRQARAIVVIAGMEGALPSVVAGYVDCPVIAVPTSVGYGANLGGVAALLAMLNSCAANVAVCNIDAGFKGGYLAGLIAREEPGNRGAS